VDQLRNKNEKLSAEVAKLKTSLAEAKAAGSRIRRIPKKIVLSSGDPPSAVSPVDRDQDIATIVSQLIESILQIRNSSTCSIILYSLIATNYHSIFIQH
jgi:hypothetical protein